MPEEQNKTTLQLSLPVFTVESFLDVVKSYLQIDPDKLVREGFPAFNKDDPRPFIKAIFFTPVADALPTQYILDVGDSGWVWIVCQSSAMVIKNH